MQQLGKPRRHGPYPVKTVAALPYSLATNDLDLCLSFTMAGSVTLLPTINFPRRYRVVFVNSSSGLVVITGGNISINNAEPMDTLILSPGESALLSARGGTTSNNWWAVRNKLTVGAPAPAPGPGPSPGPSPAPGPVVPTFSSVSPINAPVPVGSVAQIAANFTGGPPNGTAIVSFSLNPGPGLSGPVGLDPAHQNVTLNFSAGGTASRIFQYTVNGTPGSRNVEVTATTGVVNAPRMLNCVFNVIASGPSPGGTEQFYQAPSGQYLIEDETYTTWNGSPQAPTIGVAENWIPNLSDPDEFQITSGSLPPGMSLQIQPGTNDNQRTVVVIGTPTTQGVYPMGFRVQGPGMPAPNTFTITFNVEAAVEVVYEGLTNNGGSTPVGTPVTVVMEFSGPPGETVNGFNLNLTPSAGMTGLNGATTLPVSFNGSGAGYLSFVYTATTPGLKTVEIGVTNIVTGAPVVRSTQFTATAVATPTFASAAFGNVSRKVGESSTLTLSFSGLVPSSNNSVSVNLSPSAGLSGPSGVQASTVAADSSGNGTLTFNYTATVHNPNANVQATAYSTPRTANLQVFAVLGTPVFSGSTIAGGALTLSIPVTGLPVSATTSVQVAIPVIPGLTLTGQGSTNTYSAAANSSGAANIVVSGSSQYTGTKNGDVSMYGQVAAVTTFIYPLLAGASFAPGSVNPGNTSTLTVNLSGLVPSTVNNVALAFNVSAGLSPVSDSGTYAVSANGSGVGTYTRVYTGNTAGARSVSVSTDPGQSSTANLTVNTDPGASATLESASFAPGVLAAGGSSVLSVTIGNLPASTTTPVTVILAPSSGLTGLSGAQVVNAVADGTGEAIVTFNYTVGAGNKTCGVTVNGMSLTPSVVGGAPVATWAGSAHNSYVTGIDSGQALVVCYMYNDGTVEVYTAVGNGLGVHELSGSYNWFSPALAGIGGSYWVRFTVTDGFNNLTGASAAGVLHSLNSGPVFGTETASLGAISSSHLTMLVEVFSDAGGSTLVASGSISFGASREA